MHFSFSTTIRLRSNGEAPASWYFVTLDKSIALQIIQQQEVKKQMGEKRRGRGSVRVEAQIGYMKWQTSIFPDKKSGSFLLPIKKEIRKEFGLQEGSEVSIGLDLL